VATRERASGELEYVAAVAEEGEAAMPGAEPFAYYGTDRGRVEGWENRVTRRSIHSLLTFDAASWASRLPPTPLLVVHGRRDDYCAPDAAERVAAAASGELVWLDAQEHIALYDEEPHVDRALEAVAGFLHRTLGTPVSG